MKTMIGIVLMCASLTGIVRAQPLEPPPAEEIAYHWKQVKDYRALVDNPEN
ncbi:hypothetical protein [Algisphaera agarilytica]|uniref:Putative small lipoprotein YifL n=1 Tax=Algisphaera agarilytica TaxID=1385975 RepID=A0A7X0H5D3_9BACT|nr:hypothetical protein [Algisphaera agarilytica]MBB6429593.1 putative small lipoprotein YifL [Algisphaera agarilytica]